MAQGKLSVFNVRGAAGSSTGEQMNASDGQIVEERATVHFPFMVEKTHDNPLAKRKLNAPAPRWSAREP